MGLTLEGWLEKGEDFGHPVHLLPAVFAPGEELTRKEVKERLDEHEPTFEDFRRGIFHDVWSG